jgi:glutathione S-transferase
MHANPPQNVWGQNTCTHSERLRTGRVRGYTRAVILLGTNLSPFSRRVAITMRLLGIDYERRLWSTQKHAAELRQHNPMVRAPTLILDDGTTLVDSTTIFHYLFGQYPSETLLPVPGEARSRVLAISGIAVSTMEKATALFVEARLRSDGTLRPAEEEKMRDQIRTGLELLNARIEPEREPLSLAVVDAVCAFDFTKIIPESVWSGEQRNFSALAALSEKWSRESPFREIQVATA